MHLSPRLRAPLLATLGGLLAGACGALLLASTTGWLLPFPPTPPLPTSPMSRFIPAPPGIAFDGLAWLPGSGLLVASAAQSGSQRDHQLLVLERDSGSFRPLALPDEPSCQRLVRQQPTALPDGRLGYIANCVLRSNQRNSPPLPANSLLAYDPSTGSVDRLRPYSLLQGTTTFSFAPDLSRGIMAVGASPNGTLRWLDGGQLRRVDLPLTRARAPSWSPDGTWIALDGESQRRGSRQTPVSVYLLSADGQRLEPLLEGLVTAGAKSWSPDGRWLVLPIELHSGHRELWLVEVVTRRRHLLATEGPAREPVWSPDGGSIAALSGPAGPGGRASDGPPGVRIWELPDLTGVAGR